MGGVFFNKETAKGVGCFINKETAKGVGCFLNKEINLYSTAQGEVCFNKEGNLYSTATLTAPRVGCFQ